MEVDRGKILKFLMHYKDSVNQMLNKRIHLDEAWLQKKEALLDTLFGIDYARSESENSPKKEGQELYCNGLSSAALNSSYLDIYRILTALPRPITIHDMGAGYGRIGLVNSLLNSPHIYHGYEYLSSRILPARQFFAKSGQFFRNTIARQDLCESPLPMVKDQWYFFYMPIGDVVRTFFKNLIQKESPNGCHIAFVESHGDFKPFIEHLMGKTRLKTHSKTLWFPRHNDRLYYLSTESFSLKNHPHSQFWQHYFLNWEKTIIVSVNKHGKSRTDLLSQSDLSFYRGSLYLTLPDNAITSFDSNFSWTISDIHAIKS